MGEWKELDLNQIFNLAYGKNLLTSQFTGEGYDVFGANGIIGKYKTFTHEDEEVLVSCRGEYSGVIRFSNPKSYVTNNSIVCTLKETFDKKFLYYSLSAIPRYKMVSGSAQPQVVILDLKKIRIRYPKNISEQSTIALILSTIDRAIEKTERLIAKYERIKTGLMQDLLTRGIDEQGRIRSEKTHAFKDSALGRVPVEWEVGNALRISKKVTKGESPNWQGYSYQNDGVLFITSENVRDGFLDIETNKKFIPEEFHLKLKRSQLKKNDVLINLVGASVARSAILDVEVEANINQAVCLIRLTDEVIPNWFAYYLQLPQSISRLLGEQVETARANLSLANIRNFILAKPDIEEQLRINDYLDRISFSVNEYLKDLEKFNSIKTALMQDLLTGKVRVDALIK